MQLNKRQQSIVKALIQTSMNISKLAKQNNVSRTTIYEDLKTIKYWIKKDGILKKDEYLNYQITPNENTEILLNLEKNKIQIYEKKQREAIIIFKILEKYTIDQISEQLQISKNTIKNDIKNIKKNFSINDINFKYINKKYEMIGDEIKIRGFIINLLSPYIKLIKNNLEKIENDEYSLLNIDIYQLACTIQKHRYNKTDEKKYSENLLKAFFKHSEEYDNKIISNIIKLFQAYTNYEYDQTIHKTVSDHFQSARYRLKLHILLKNPVYDEIITNYKEYFEIIKLLLNHYFKNTDDKFINQEASYITLILISQNKIEKNEKKILVVCYEGLTISHSLKQQLINLGIKEETIECTTFNEIKNYDYQCIISTINIKNALIVNPILSINDKIKIKKHFNLFEMEQLVEAIKNNVNEQLFNKIINESLNQNIKNKEGEIMLKDLLTSQTINFGNVNNWEETIHLAAIPLLKQKIIKEKYIDQVINNVKENGPYIILKDDFALPHARPSEDVLKIGMSLLILENPISFSSDENNKASVIVLLAARDTKSHLNALSELITMMGDDEIFQKIKNSKTKEEVLNLMEEL